jgi:hypothetical protein
MRAIVAALFVLGCVCAAAALLGEFRAMDRPPWGAGVGLGLFMLALSVLALLLVNARGSDALGLKTPEELLRQLEDEGLLVSSDFRARSAFCVRESADEGPHYLLELADGRVLYLSGQCLYDYEPVSDDPEVSRPRRFPCTDFTVRRHKLEGHVVEVVRRGAVIEPELILPPFTKRGWRSIGTPKDGQVMPDRPYDLLKDLPLEDAER